MMWQSLLVVVTAWWSTLGGCPAQRTLQVEAVDGKRGTRIAGFSLALEVDRRTPIERRRTWSYDGPINPLRTVESKEGACIIEPPPSGHIWVVSAADYISVPLLWPVEEDVKEGVVVMAPRGSATVALARAPGLIIVTSLDSGFPVKPGRYSVESSERGPVLFLRDVPHGRYRIRASIGRELTARTEVVVGMERGQRNEDRGARTDKVEWRRRGFRRCLLRVRLHGEPGRADGAILRKLGPTYGGAGFPLDRDRAESRLFGGECSLVTGRYLARISGVNYITAFSVADAQKDRVDVDLRLTKFVPLTVAPRALGVTLNATKPKYHLRWAVMRGVSREDLIAVGDELRGLLGPEQALPHGGQILVPEGRVCVWVEADGCWPTLTVVDTSARGPRRVRPTVTQKAKLRCQFLWRDQRRVLGGSFHARTTAAHHVRDSYLFASGVPSWETLDSARGGTNSLRVTCSGTVLARQSIGLKSGAETSARVVLGR